MCAKVKEKIGSEENMSNLYKLISQLLTSTKEAFKTCWSNMWIFFFCKEEYNCKRLLKHKG